MQPAIIVIEIEIQAVPDKLLIQQRSKSLLTVFVPSSIPKLEAREVSLAETTAT